MRRYPMNNNNLETINGLNIGALKQFAGAVEQNSNDGIAKFQVTTEWTGGQSQPRPLRK